MLQYILTGLAGIALGIVAMRVWQMCQTREPAAADAGEAPAGKEQAAITGSSAASKPNSRFILIGAGALAAVAVAVIALKPGDSAGPSPNAVGMPGAVRRAPAATRRSTMSIR